MVAAGPPVKQPRILTLDIETRPIVAHVWGLFDQRVGLNQILDPGGVMCFGAKWLGEKDVQFYSDWEHGHEAMIAHAHRLLTEADIVIGYNHDRFDLTKLNWEFAQARLTRPRPYRTVDLLKVARSQFGAPSRKLDFIAGELGVGHKVKHEGHTLWTKCLSGDAKAQARMDRYCCGDVKVTERLYLRMLPWIPQHPNMALYTGEDGACPNCGGKSFRKDGVTTTAQTQYAQSQCRKCGAWVRNNFVKNRTLVRTVR